jgi:UDP-glucose 4-epimerase
MAASSLVGDSITDPGRYYANILVASTRLFDALVQASIQPLVFSSTAAVTASRSVSRLLKTFFAGKLE